MKDKQCMKCERLFECKGKPEGSKECLQYKERKDGTIHKTS